MPRLKTIVHPGFCTMRLRNIQTLSSPAKTALLQSIANDISATFIYLAKQAEANTLNPEHTAPINDVIAIIKDTTASQRRTLERRMARYERRTKRLRAERKWAQWEFRRVVQKAEMVHGRWKGTVGRLREGMERMRRELVLAREECALLQQAGRKSEQIKDRA